MSAPFFTLPLDSLTGTLRNIASALRTLPEQQLADETALLAALVGKSHCIASRAMLAAYEAETARRASGEHKFDAELIEALSTLEKNTNEPDRVRVRRIGEQLHRMGGTAFTRRAFDRATADCNPRSAELRANILNKRWTGLLA